MADPITLTGLLVAGGTVAAQATLEEVTRDAWQTMKGVIHDLFGRRASANVEKLERTETRDAGRSELQKLLATVTDEEAAQIVPAADRLVTALRQDQTAMTVLTRNRINLDLDVAGDVLLQRIRGAHEMNVRSTSGGDFTMTDVAMGGEPNSGN